MSQKPNSTSLFIYITNDYIQIRHLDGILLAEWYLDNLVKRFKEKTPAMLYITAEVEVRDGIEYFHYIRSTFKSYIKRSSYFTI